MVGGRGSRRRFGLVDLVVLRVVHDLAASGVRVRALAPALRLLQKAHRRESLEALADVTVWTDGRDAGLVDQSWNPPSDGAITYYVPLTRATSHVQRSLQQINHTTPSLGDANT